MYNTDTTQRNHARHASMRGTGRSFRSILFSTQCNDAIYAIRLYGICYMLYAMLYAIRLCECVSPANGSTFSYGNMERYQRYSTTTTANGLQQTASTVYDLRSRNAISALRLTRTNTPRTTAVRPRAHALDSTPQ